MLYLQDATVVGKDTDYCWLCKFIFFHFLFFLSPSQLLFSDSFLSPSQLRQGGNLVLPQSASSAFLLVQVLVSLSSTVFYKKSMGLGLGFVAAGVVKELVVVVLWRLGAGVAGFW
jgi:hypothetical protein